MKNIYSIIAFSFLVLLSVNMVSARADYLTSTEIVFKQGMAVNIDTLENICSENTCEIVENDALKLISFKINEQGRDVILNLFRYKSEDYYSLVVVDRTEDLTMEDFKSEISTGLYLLGNAFIIPGIDEQEVSAIVENVKGYKNVIYFNPSSCGGNGWTTNESAGYCEFKGYEGSCPKLECNPPCTDPENCPLTGFNEGLEKTSLDSLSYLDLPLGPWSGNCESDEVWDENSRTCIQKPLGPGMGENSSNLLYWIMGIALVLVIILFLILRKKK
jgi:hypothetical protein